LDANRLPVKWGVRLHVVVVGFTTGR